MRLLIHLPLMSIDISNALVPILPLIIYTTLMRRNFDLMVKAYLKIIISGRSAYPS